MFKWVKKFQERIGYDCFNNEADVVKVTCNIRINDDKTAVQIRDAHGNIMSLIYSPWTTLPEILVEVEDIRRRLIVSKAVYMEEDWLYLDDAAFRYLEQIKK